MAISKDHLGKRSKAVSSTASIRNNIHAWFVGSLIYSHHEHRCISRRSRDHNLFGTTLNHMDIEATLEASYVWRRMGKAVIPQQPKRLGTNLLVCWCLLNCCEDSRWFNNKVSPIITPWNFSWIPAHKHLLKLACQKNKPCFVIILSDMKRNWNISAEKIYYIPFAGDFYLLPIDFQGWVVQNLESSLEASMSRIILKHVSLKILEDLEYYFPWYSFNINMKNKIYTRTQMQREKDSWNKKRRREKKYI